MTADPRRVADAIVSAAATADPGPGGGLQRRIATVTAVNSAGTVSVTWPTGDTITSVPICCDPWPLVGDVVLLLGAAGTDWAVWGIVQGHTAVRPQAGQGVVARVSTTSDGVGFSGTSAFEVTQLRTSTYANFATGRLYRSTFVFGETANGGNDSAFVTLKRSGGVQKGEITATTIIADGFGFATTLAGTIDYNMPSGSFNLQIFLNPTGRGMKFYALGNAFHTVEDIGPDAW